MTTEDVIEQHAASYRAQPVTDERLMYAAPGLALLVWRNTETIEDHMHAGRGVWSDEDMLRVNARATRLCWDVLKALDGLERHGQLDRGAVEAEMFGLPLDLKELLPTTPKVRRKQYDRETFGRFMHQAALIDRFGLDYWLHILEVTAPSHWWCAPGWPGIVEDYLALPGGPPDPATFARRMHEAPWELDDDQARYVVDHRYDVGHHR
jgi:hypothetical protein